MKGKDRAKETKILLGQVRRVLQTVLRSAFADIVGSTLGRKRRHQLYFSERSHFQGQGSRAYDQEGTQVPHAQIIMGGISSGMKHEC